jgi:hypothetical protein
VRTSSDRFTGSVTTPPFPEYPPPHRRSFQKGGVSGNIGNGRVGHVLLTAAPGFGRHFETDFETLRALTSGPAACVSKLTHFDTCRDIVSLMADPRQIDQIELIRRGVWWWNQWRPLGSGETFALVSPPPVELGSATESSSSSATAAELVLASGERLNIASGADAATLRTVLGVLREKS